MGNLFDDPLIHLTLRQRAEMRLKTGNEVIPSPDLSQDSLKDFLYEFKVQEIELEIQDEELKKVRCELIQQNRQLTQIKRLYGTLSQIAEITTRSKDSAELYRAICDAAVERGKFLLAWIGILNSDTGEIRPVAAHGLVPEHWPTSAMNLFRGVFKDSLVALALRTSRVHISEDLESDQRSQPYRNQISGYDYHSSAAVPFGLGGKIIGILSLISNETSFFRDEEEVRLLEKMGAEISFALEKIEAEKKKSEAERIQRQWADAFENCASGISLGVPTLNQILTCNLAFARLLGRTAEELSSMPILNLYPPEDHDLVKRSMDQADRTGSVQFEAHMVRKDGTVYPVQIDLVSVKDEKGNIRNRVATQQDITERQQALRAIITSEAMYRSLFDHMAEGYAYCQMIFDQGTAQDWTYLDVNDAFSNLTGLQNVKGKKVSEIIPNIRKMDPEIFEIYSRVTMTGKHEEFEYFLKSLQQWFSVSVYSPRKEFFVSVFDVITERKLAEKEILQRNEDLQIINSLNESINRGEDMNGILGAFLRETHEAFHCQNVSLYFLSPNHKFIELTGNTLSRKTNERIEKLIGQPVPKVRIPLAEGSFYRELMENESGSLLNDPQDIQRLIGEFANTTFLPAIFRAGIRKIIPQIFNALNIHSIIGIPLISSGQVIGILELSSRDQFTEEDLHRVRNINKQVAVSIRHKQSEDRIRIQFQRISALGEINHTISSNFNIHLSLDILVSEVCSQLKVDAASVLLLNSTTQILDFAAEKGFSTQNNRLTHLQLGNGPLGQACLEHRIIHIPDLNQERNGFQRSNFFKSEEFVEYYGVPLITKGSLKGVLEVFHRSQLDTDEEWLVLLETIGRQAAIAIDNAQLFESLQQSNMELVAAYDATIDGWSKAMDLRDKETEGHTQRVTELTLKLAEIMGIRQQELVHIRRGALLHDIGKLGIPDYILLKPGMLTGEEIEIMHQHPNFALDLLTPITYLQPALDIPYCHHEKWDGTGYPRGLKGEEIPLAARLFAIVDVWDALRSDRPYRPSWSEEQTRQYILEQSGKQFDPGVVHFFMDLIDNGGMKSNP